MKRRTLHSYILQLLAGLALVFSASATFAGQPITTDSRIKTFVYNANEVFSITTHYGYHRWVTAWVGKLFRRGAVFSFAPWKKMRTPT